MNTTNTHIEVLLPNITDFVGLKSVALSVHKYLTISEVTDLFIKSHFLFLKSFLFVRLFLWLLRNFI